MSIVGNLLNGIIQFVIQLLGWIAGLIVKPVINIVMSVFPDLGDQVDTINTFLNDYMFKGMAFVREVFFNISGANRQIFYWFITLFFARIAIKYGLQAFYFIRNMWRLFKTGETKGEMVE